MQSLLQRLLLGNAGGGGGGNPTLNYNFVDGSAFPSAITFTRGSNATQFDSSGNLVYAPVNLEQYSEDFTNLFWTPANATVSGNAAVSPNNTTTADKLITTNALTGGQIFTTTPLAALSDFTFSVFAKASEWGWLRLTTRGPENSDIGAYFDLSNGVVGTTDAGVTAAIQLVGNGWYRCAVTRTTGTGAAAARQRIYATNADNVLSTGDGTSGIFIWGAQLNPTPVLGGVTASLSTYYPTTTTAYYGPRLDYDPATLAAQGFLVEEQRTNSIRNSTMQGAVAGTPGTAPTNYTLTSSGAVTRNIVGVGTENGITYIDVQFSSAGANNFFITPEPGTQIAAASGQTWASSFYVRLIGGTLSNLAIDHNIQENSAAGAFLAATITAFTPTSASLVSQRNTITRTLNNASTAFVQSYIRGVASGAYDITLRIGLPQLELGAFATSVIPTTTTALTRSADVASVNTLSPWFNSTSGTLYAEFSIPASTASRAQATFGDGTANERLIISNNSSLTGTSWRIVDGGVDQADINNSGSFANNATVKVAGAYAVNDFATSQNGGTVGTDTSGTLPTVTALYLGSNGAAQYASSHLRQIRYYPVRLTNAALQQITT